MKRSFRVWLICMSAVSVASILSGCATSGARTDGKGDGDRGQRAGALKVGDSAPGFALKTLDEVGKTVRLTSFRGQRPVVLFFGSYT